MIERLGVWGLVWAIGAFVLWLQFSKKQRYRSFDISVIAASIALFVNRLIFILLSGADFSHNYWSVFPYAWINGQLELLASKPWFVFAIWRGDFDFDRFLFSLIISILVVLLVSNTKILPTVDKIFKTVLYLLVPMLLALMYFSEYVGRESNISIGIFYAGDETFRLPIQLIQIGAFAGILILTRLFGVFEKLRYPGISIFALFVGLNIPILYYLAQEIPATSYLWSNAFIIFALLVVGAERVKIRFQNSKTTESKDAIMNKVQGWRERYIKRQRQKAISRTTPSKPSN